MHVSRFLRTHTGKGASGRAIRALPHVTTPPTAKSWRALSGIAADRAGRRSWPSWPASCWPSWCPRNSWHRGSQHVLSQELNCPAAPRWRPMRPSPKTIASQAARGARGQETLVTIGGTSQSEITARRSRSTWSRRHQRKFTRPRRSSKCASSSPAGPTARTSTTRSSRYNFAGGGSSAFRSAMLQFNVRGRNYDEISKATDELTAWMKTQPGYVDVDVSYRGGKPRWPSTSIAIAPPTWGCPSRPSPARYAGMMAGDKVSEISSDGQRWERAPEAGRSLPPEGG